VEYECETLRGGDLDVVAVVPPAVVVSAIARLEGDRLCRRNDGLPPRLLRCCCWLVVPRKRRNPKGSAKLLSMLVLWTSIVSIVEGCVPKSKLLLSRYPLYTTHKTHDFRVGCCLVCSRASSVYAQKCKMPQPHFFRCLRACKLFDRVKTKKLKSQTPAVLEFRD
jgi:hypothetical protein